MNYNQNIMKDHSAKINQLRETLIKHSSYEVNTSFEFIVDQYCSEYEIYLQAMDQIKDEGFENKHGQISPAMTARNQAIGNMAKLYKQLPLRKDTPLPGPDPRSIKNF